MLNNTQIKNFKPKDKLYRKTDSGGLVLEVKPSGVKAWRYRYRWQGKATMMALGNYPEISLAHARRLRDDAREKLNSNLNPAKEAKQNNSLEVKAVLPTFGEMYLEWYEHNSESWSYEYAKDVNERCQNHLLPYLQNRKIAEITAMDMLEVFKKIEARGTLNMLKKVRGYASRVFRYSVGMGRCPFDPTRDLPADVFKKEQSKSYASTTEPHEIGRILRLIRSYSGFYATRLALMLVPYVMLRPGEVVNTLVSEIDLENRVIRKPSSHMKMKRDHLVPLSSQAVEIIEEALELNMGSQYLFPGTRSLHNHLSRDTLRLALRRLGIKKEELTTHGFRHMASTILHEQGWLSDAIERQMAHVEENKVKGVYNKAKHMDIRTQMMQEWADYLDGLI